MNARAATWRDESGRTVATVYGETACLNPRLPRDLAAATEDGGFESILRCRNCAGCRKYDALQLRRRLAEHYKGVTDEISVVIVEAPQVDHCRLASRVRRNKFVRFEPGLYRLGDASFALVARGERPPLDRVRALHGRTWRVEKIGRRRNGRAFRVLTRGMLVERSAYGQWSNRFYHVGLARPDSERFDIERRGGIRKRHPEARGGMRAWRGGLTLYPSLTTQGAELVALLLNRDGDLNGRKCTHEKCPPERCHYAHRAPAATSIVKSGGAKAPPLTPPMTGFRDRASAHGVQGEPATGNPIPMKHSDALPRNPKASINSVNGGRDAGSSQVGSGFEAGWLERMREIARKRSP